jgi:hypothetical protein
MKWKLMASTVALFNALFGTERTTIDAENKQLSLNAEQRQQVVDALGEKMLKKRLLALMAKLKPWLMEI